MSIGERRARCAALTAQHYRGWRHPHELLQEAVRQLIPPNTRILDLGTGAAFPLLQWCATIGAFSVGIDMVPPHGTPPPRTAIIRGDLATLPFCPQSFDAAVSYSVFEHLTEPQTVFADLHRVVRPGGRLIFTTPNRYDYASIIAKLAPDSWADAFLHWALGEQSHDHFPVYYRVNTRRALERVAARTGWHVEQITALCHPPIYLCFSPILWRLGMLYDRALVALQLEALQPAWLVVMRRG